jgi:nicotinamidase-related amidase
LPSLVRPVLLVVDLQRLFCDPGSPAYTPGWRESLGACRRLAPVFRARGLPVFWTRHVHDPGDSGGTLGFFYSRLQRRDDPLSALTGDLDILVTHGRIVEKWRFSALCVPEVEEAVRASDAVVVLGVRTDQCVLATLVEAARLGARPVVVADGCASVTWERHAAALRVLAQGHAHLATVDELLASLGVGRGEGGCGDDP